MNSKSLQYLVMWRSGSLRCKGSAILMSYNKTSSQRSRLLLAVNCILSGLTRTNKRKVHMRWASVGIDDGAQKKRSKCP